MKTNDLASRIPWTLVVFLAALFVPWLGSRYDIFLATQIAISGLFAVSLNLLLGTTGLVSFGHVAYFGIGAYVCGILMKTYAMPFSIALPAAALGAAFASLVFGFFCVRLTRIYFAMLSLAFSQIIWAIAYKWNDVTGGDQGLPDVPYPDLDWMTSIPLFGDLRIAGQFYVLTLVVVGLSLAAMRRIIHSPFGRMLTTIRENAERASAIGVDVRRYELAAFVVAGGFAGIAGALFGIFNRGVFSDYVFWPKSAEVMIMTILGGIDHFWGPVGRRGDAGAPEPGDHVLHRVLVVRARHDPARAAVRLPRRHRRRPVAGFAWLRRKRRVRQRRGGCRGSRVEVKRA